MINNIALAGCGNVGTALLEILHEKKAELKERYGFEYQVVLVSDLMKGIVMDPNGLDLGKLLDEIHGKRSFGALAQAAGHFEELLDRSGATVLAECTPTNLKTGEPGLAHLKAALSRGINVTTTNKGPIAVAFDELCRLEKDCGAKLCYEGVVMSGTPLIDMMKNGIAGCTVLGLEGILNGTTNFILTKMGEGSTYADALAEATALGYAEADPSGDVTRIGITQVTPQQIAEARRSGFTIKLVAGIRFDSFGMHPYVMPKEIALTHPLAAIGGATNAITVNTDNLGEITLVGPGAGRRETGQALLSDMIRMSR